jgi:hypothetical protein
MVTLQLGGMTFTVRFDYPSIDRVEALGIRVRQLARLNARRLVNKLFADEGTFIEVLRALVKDQIPREWNAAEFCEYAMMAGEAAPNAVRDAMVEYLQKFHPGIKVKNG